MYGHAGWRSKFVQSDSCGWQRTNLVPCIQDGIHLAVYMRICAQQVPEARPADQAKRVTPSSSPCETAGKMTISFIGREKLTLPDGQPVSVQKVLTCQPRRLGFRTVCTKSSARPAVHLVTVEHNHRHSHSTASECCRCPRSPASRRRTDRSPATAYRHSA